MTKRLKLLLLDAGVVIHLHELGLWAAFTEQCDVHLTRTVADVEVRYCDRPDSRVDIDLSPDRASGRITVADVDASVLNQFLDQFDPVYMEGLDPGEREALAFLVAAPQEYLISSGDKIVYRVLGRLQRAEQGLSLEEALAKIGLGRHVAYPYSRAFRERWTKQGQQDMIRGIGLKR
jgi:hypothetical protein